MPMSSYGPRIQWTGQLGSNGQYLETVPLGVLSRFWEPCIVTFSNPGIRKSLGKALGALNGSRRFRPTEKHARLAARSGMRWSNVP